MRKSGRSIWTAAILAAGVAGLATVVVAEDCKTAAVPAAPVDDFTTRTKGDYMYACMQVNGPNQLTLEKCACSIDVIAGLIKHDEYIEAETIMSYTLRGGESTGAVKHLAAREIVHKLKLAQLEGELKCF